MLVVEDDQDQLTIRAMLLRQNGLRAVEADTRQAALEAAAHQPIDCVVMDLRLPTDQEGLLLLQTLKSRDPACRVYVLTGDRNAALASYPELATAAEEVFAKGLSIRPLIERLKGLPPRSGSVGPQNEVDDDAGD